MKLCKFPTYSTPHFFSLLRRQVDQTKGLAMNTFPEGKRPINQLARVV